jgi:hypothetical protein
MGWDTPIVLGNESAHRKGIEQTMLCCALASKVSLPDGYRVISRFDVAPAPLGRAQGRCLDDLHPCEKDLYLVCLGGPFQIICDEMDACPSRVLRSRSQTADYTMVPQMGCPVYTPEQGVKWLGLLLTRSTLD